MFAIAGPSPAGRAIANVSGSATVSPSSFASEVRSAAEHAKELRRQLEAEYDICGSPGCMEPRVKGKARIVAPAQDDGAGT